MHVSPQTRQLLSFNFASIWKRRLFKRIRVSVNFLIIRKLTLTLITYWFSIHSFLTVCWLVFNTVHARLVQLGNGFNHCMSCEAIKYFHSHKILTMDWEFPVLSLWWRKLFTPSCNTPCIMLNKNCLQSPELGDFTQSRSWIMEPVLRYPCPALLAQGWIRIMKALKTKLTFTRFRQRDRSHFYEGGGTDRIWEAPIKNHQEP